MFPCHFPCGSSHLKTTNDFNVIAHANSYSFELDNVKFKGQDDEDKSKYRITLRHKENGNVTHFDSKWLSFKPTLPKLKAADAGNNKGVSKTQLLKEFGTVKDQRHLKEVEKHQVNAEAQKAVRDAQIATTKTELSDARKGKNMETSYMETEISNIDGVSVPVGDKKMIKLSMMAPEEILNSLNEDAIELSAKTSAELSELVIKQILHKSVLLVLKLNSAKDISRIQLCLLLNHMITFYLLPIKIVRSKLPIENCPNVVLKFLIQNYTLTVSSSSSKPQIQVPKEEKDKLITMILALYSYLTEYSFSLGALQVDLKASTERLKKYLQVFNVKVTKQKDSNNSDLSLNDFIASTTVPFVINS